MIYIVASIVMGLLAVNGGNNFHYLTAAVMLGYMLASGMAGRRNIRGANISLSFPDEIYANVPFLIDVRVHNKGRVPIFLIDVRVGSSNVFFPVVQPGETAVKSASFQLSARGESYVDDIDLSSIYPFDFFTRYWPISFRGRVTAYPEPKAFAWNESGARLSGLEENERSKEKTDAERDVVGVRPYAEGDPMRIIHWKSAARTGRLNSRMYDGSQDAGARVIDLDALVASGLERGLSAASYEISRALKTGTPIGMKDRGSIWPPSESRADKLSMLENLALYEQERDSA
jgi:uncharacterized protein (DUF58 family)